MGRPRSHQSLTRRAWLLGAAATGIASAGPSIADGFCRDAHPSLGDIRPRRPALGAVNPRVIWGTALEAPGLYDARLIDAMVAESPRCIAIASGLKFGNLFPTESTEPDLPLWHECDDIVALASKLGIAVRGDCLAWNDWVPAWLTAIARDRPTGWNARLARHYEAHFEAVFAHVAQLRRRDPKADLRWCGLVNEPFDPWSSQDGRPSWRKGAWLDAFGSAKDGVPLYIHKAFELGGRLAAPHTALFVNETNCDNDKFGPLVRPALLRLVDALQHAGRRIDAVGLECHLMPQWMAAPDEPDWRDVVRFLHDLDRRGVEIYLTELDVNDCGLRDLRRRDARVAHYIGSFIEAALTVPAVKMVTDWDFSDRYAWLRGSGVYPSLSAWAGCVVDPPCPRPTIYDEALRPKPARDAMANALNRRR